MSRDLSDKKGEMERAKQNFLFAFRKAHEDLTKAIEECLEEDLGK